LKVTLAAGMPNVTGEGRWENKVKNDKGEVKKAGVSKENANRR